MEGTRKYEGLLGAAIMFHKVRSIVVIEPK